MTQPSLISQSRRYYQRFYRLVAFAVILMTAVLTGSLLLGDSVRDTLVRRVSERLGKTETIITSGTGFLSDRLMQHPLMAHSQGYLMMDGFVSIGDKLLPVYVWGVDNDSLMSGEVMINEPLEANLGDVEDFVLHLPSNNLVPSGSLFVTKNYATKMRVHVSGVKSVEEGGNILLKNEQTLPFNVFVGRQYLAETMGLEGKMNLVLSDDLVDEEQLAKCWTPEMSGIHLTDSSLTYDGVFISSPLVDKCRTANSTVYFSYFVNDLIHGTDTVPYSFVTAVNEWHGEPLEGRNIILSDYASERLGVHEGDSVRMSYFITKQLKSLETREQTFMVKRVVPLSDFMHDSLLLADFPGLTHVEKCTDWDSDVPIKMEHVHKVDEDYWYAYRQTPKAVVAYDAVGSDWSNAFGSATALRFVERPEVSLTPSDAGVLLFHPREQGLAGAKGGVDFSSLFLSLGFFIILASIMLMKSPLTEMFTLRLGEIQLYRQLGFTEWNIGRRLFEESFCIMLLASPLGVAAGLAYSSITLWLLGNVWSGATHTEGFALHVQPMTLLIGWVTGMIICAFALFMVVRNMLRQGQGVTKEKSAEGKLDKYLFVGLFVFTSALITVNFLFLHELALFIICGLLWILTWGFFLRVYVSRQVREAESDGKMSRRRLTWLSIRASIKQHLQAYWALSLGVFTVFAVGLNRPDFGRAIQATGGYNLYVDSRVPIQYDLNNRAVRNKLSLDALPDSTQFLGFMRHTQDEASCINLNQVTTPTVLGVNLEDMESFGLIVEEGKHDHTIAQLYIDEESLLWSLMKSVGDTLYYQNDKGERVPVLIAGSYPTGIFHGNAIMSSDDFRRLWPKEVGVEVLLVKSPRADEAAEILSTAMSEYGLNIQSVEERIRMFFEVTETYLIIFMTLGGLGLLLGIFSLMIIVRKNLAAQAHTIRQYRAMGFDDSLVAKMLLHENLLVPLYAVCVGATGSVISISANVAGAGITTLLMAFAGFLGICILLYYGIKEIISSSSFTCK